MDASGVERAVLAAVQSGLTWRKHVEAGWWPRPGGGMVTGFAVRFHLKGRAGKTCWPSECRVQGKEKQQACQAVG